MKNLLFIFVCTLLLTGCGQQNPAKILQDIQNNKEGIIEKAKESRGKRAEEAQKNGYPEIWINANLPEYPNGKLTKVRASMGQITLETNDDLNVVKEFFDKEMKNREFVTEQEASSPMVVTTFYKKEKETLHMQAIKNEKQKITKIILAYYTTK